LQFGKASEIFDSGVQGCIVTFRFVPATANEAAVYFGLNFKEKQASNDFLELEPIR